MNNKPTIFIGIDPAERKNGFAICIIDTSDNTVSFKPFKSGLVDFFSWILNDAPDQIQVLFCVENSNLQKELFYTHRAIDSGALLSSSQAKYIKSRKLSIGEIKTACMSVGKNQAISQNTVDILKARNYNVIDISPREKGKKWSEIECLAVSKQEKHELGKHIKNQDCRDSYKLALIAKDRSKKPFKK